MYCVRRPEKEPEEEDGFFLSNKGKGFPSGESKRKSKPNQESFFSQRT
jgi:hypothetical protein